MSSADAVSYSPRRLELTGTAGRLRSTGTHNQHHKSKVRWVYFFQTYCQAYSNPGEQFSRWPCRGSRHYHTAYPLNRGTAKKNIPGIGCRAIRTSPSDSNTRSRRAPRARTRGSEGGRSPRRGRPPHRTRARAPRATRVNLRCWRAGRVDEGEGMTLTTLLGGERPCPARVSTI